MGVPRAAYKATRSEEYSFDEHETLRILACQSWVKEVCLPVLTTDDLRFFTLLVRCTLR